MRNGSLSAPFAFFPQRSTVPAACTGVSCICTVALLRCEQGWPGIQGTERRSAIGAAASPLLGSRRRGALKSPIAAAAIVGLLFFLTFSLKLVLKLLQVAVGLSCNVGWGGCPFALAVAPGVFWPGRTEEGRHLTSKCRAQITKVFRFFCKTPVWQLQVAAATLARLAVLCGGQRRSPS